MEKEEEKKEELTRDSLQKARKKIQWKGWWIVAILWILAVFVGGSLGSDPAIAFFGLPAFGIMIYMYAKRRDRAAKKIKTTTCYECKTEIDLEDKWQCDNCKDVTRRHIFSKCPSCKTIFERFSCPSCETTLDV